jgi:plasmid stabilization system protein ParE
VFADNPLFDQIDHATVLLRENPELGKIVRRGRSTIHRLVLPSHWHLYYRYLADRALVETVAVWYGGRGDEPLL